MSYLSTKNIPTNERLIIALDVASFDAAKALVNQIGDAGQFYKVGLKLFMVGEYFELVQWLIDNDKKVFVDLKFFDIPQTVQNAVGELAKHGADFCTVHGNQNMIEAAASVKGDMNLLAVTVLTSMDEDDIRDLGFTVDVEEVVLSRAKRMVEAGADGVIASGIEAPKLREELGDHFLIVSPGIRPVANVDDQQRTVNVPQAFENGADYIVVGRPIYEADDPAAAAQEVQQQIATVFA